MTPVKEQCGEDGFQKGKAEVEGPRREDLSLRRVVSSVDGIEEEALEMYKERKRRKGMRTFILVSIALPGRGKQGREYMETATWVELVGIAGDFSNNFEKRVLETS